MRIETMTPGMPVHVTPSSDTIELWIGEPRAAGASVASLSVPQAEMLLHALGFRIAEIEERQRRETEARKHLAQDIENTEVRRR